MHIFISMNRFYHNLIFLNDMFKLFLNLKINSKLLLNENHWRKRAGSHNDWMRFFLLNWIETYFWAEALYRKNPFSQFIDPVVPFISNNFFFVFLLVKLRFLLIIYHDSTHIRLYKIHLAIPLILETKRFWKYFLP